MDPVAVCQARSGGLPGRLFPGLLEEGDQLLGDGLGCEQRGEVADAGQFADMRVGDVLSDVGLLTDVDVVMKGGVLVSSG